MPRLPSRYSFTLNNYTEYEYSSLQRSLESSCKYAILGREVGERGTPHLQGYCIFTTGCSFNTVKDRLNPRVHVEVSRGSPRENRRYCRKDGEYWEHGECPNSGPSTGAGPNRDELSTEFNTAMVEGRRGLVRFATERPGTWIFHGHVMLRNYYELQDSVQRDSISVDWFFGPPGSGKSRRAHETLPEAYIKDPRTKWWNGYKLETDCIIDDFGPGGIDINHLLRWFDRYKCHVETKGGMLPLHATKFIVTSNFHPRQLFRNFNFSNNVSEECEHPQMDALLRRITVIEFHQ